MRTAQNSIDKRGKKKEREKQKIKKTKSDWVPVEL